MTDFRETRDPHLRIAILRFLAVDRSRSLNASLLVDACKGVGIGTASDDMEYQLQWLEEHRLVTVKREANWTVATLTKRGEEVAEGTLIVKGIKRPSPDQ